MKIDDRKEKLYNKNVIQSFKDLEVYQESYELAILINREVNKLPIFERSDLGSQLRRASKSVPANIAEGWAKRRFEKQFKVHLDPSIGSCNEMEVHISMGRDLKYWEHVFCESLIKRYLFLGGRLTNLRNNWKTY